ncbi:hypothetical protein GCM10025876_24120 [Demequina litorisediminis]|uniref:Uncharacterized protein n=1 Tax=Demequina litorisediminis TaxID=1849022 RepID=A0ABQ6IGC7_9MICO|nr:hypothetical protein GCM10025876_24120 [Demequina litorisediminis]
MSTLRLPQSRQDRGRDQQHHRTTARKDGRQGDGGAEHEDEDGADGEERQAHGECRARTVEGRPRPVLIRRGIEDRLGHIVVHPWLGQEPAAGKGQDVAIVHTLRRRAETRIEFAAVSTSKGVPPMHQRRVENAKTPGKPRDHLHQRNRARDSDIKASVLAHDADTHQ